MSAAPQDSTQKTGRDWLSSREKHPPQAAGQPCEAPGLGAWSEYMYECEHTLSFCIHKPHIPNHHSCWLSTSIIFFQKLMTVRDTHVREPEVPGGNKTSLSPCKRQRLDEGYETESSDSVEDMLRDISTRCNAVLHGAASGTGMQQESETVCMHGAFTGLQTSISMDSSMVTDWGAEPEENVSSFRTSVREHCTIRTRVFPHGRAFTSRTQRGGYRFRWVPDHSWNQG